MSIATIAIIFSAISLCVSLSSFIWTIYKDTRYRARVRLRLSRQRVDNFPPRPVLEIFNDGPGSITLDYYIRDSRPWIKRFSSNESHKNLIISESSLDKKLNAGESHRQLMDNWEFYGKNPWKLVGVADKFRNAYFVPRSQIRAVVRQASKDEKKLQRRT